MTKPIIILKGQDKTSEIKFYKEIGNIYEVVFANGKLYHYSKKDVKIISSSLDTPYAKNVFAYLKEIAKESKLFTPEGENILAMHYSKIDFIREDSCLHSYLTGHYKNIESINKLVIFPFGFNSSQKKAVENALNNSISIIQGPPGSGKTQTILNIIANALINGETVAVVSNNNTATANIQEKLDKYNLGFVSAYLGNTQNKQEFIKTQQTNGTLPSDIEAWELSNDKIDILYDKLRTLSEQLTRMLQERNHLADVQQKKMILHTEYLHFLKYYEDQSNYKEIKLKRNMKAADMLSFCVMYETYYERTDKLGWFKRFYLWLKYGLNLKIAKTVPFQIVMDNVKKQYYELQETEWSKEIKECEKKLENFDFDGKMKEYTELSMIILKSFIGKKYRKQQRSIYKIDELWKRSNTFLKDYPVILSTTYSLRSSLSKKVVYDYVIIDESSQVDLVTGALAMSCAKKAVIVGDSKQLPNVVKDTVKSKTNDIFKDYSIPEAYRYSNHTFLQSIIEVLPGIKQTLLKEHYRCHPKIIGFCNEKFYDGQLIILSKDECERMPLVLYKTVPGNHARQDNINKREIDVIKEEVIPQEKLYGKEESIGIVTPYRNQVEELKKTFNGTGIQSDTVDKFQGREKDIMILSTVDNQISDFADQPNRLNVAVSRAKKQLIVVTNGNSNNRRGYIQDLINYIEYNNLKITKSKVYSVFDYLYQQYNDIRQKILQKNKISEYDSENLMYQLIKKILEKTEFTKYHVAVHVPLRTILKDFSELTREEAEYVRHSSTHVDFLIFDRIDKSPKLIIEVDGVSYHKEGTKQAERDKIKDTVLKKYNLLFLRCKTNESREEQKITEKLQSLE